MREIVSQAKDVEARGENKEKELLYSFVVYDMNDLPPPAPHDKWRRRQDDLLHRQMASSTVQLYIVEVKN